MDTDEVTRFLTAQIDEDERAVRLLLSDYAEHRPDWSIPATGVVDIGRDLLPTGDGPLAEYIGAHDPAQTLLDVAAKRALLALHALVEVPVSLVVGDVEYACSLCDTGCCCGSVCSTYVDPLQAVCDTKWALVRAYERRPGFKPEWKASSSRALS